MGAGKTNSDGALRNIGALVYSVPDSGGRPVLRTLEKAAVAFLGGRVAWAGRDRDLTRCVTLLRRAPVIDAGGRAVVPGLVECHTHAVFAGSRVDDFEHRAGGLTYAAIARAGGGIASTVHATRAAPARTLAALGRTRLDRFLRRGVTTVEIKSGYGLDTASEMKMLGVIAALRRAHPITVVATFLGAHTVPPEYANRRQAYVDLVVDEMIPHVAALKLARFADVFCEETAFTVDEARRILRAGMRHGLRPKVHADQLTSCGGAELAAEVGAISADHLEHVSASGIEQLGEAGVVAVLLPTASLFIGTADRAPARRLIEAGVRVAISTDYNPGSSNTQDLALAGTIACAQLKLTPVEALAAITVNAAAAIGMEREVGTLETGRFGDAVVLETRDWRDLFYCMGENLARTVIKKGRVLGGASTGRDG